MLPTFESIIESAPTEKLKESVVVHRLDDHEAQRVIDRKIDIKKLVEKLNFPTWRYDTTLLKTIARLVLELKESIAQYDTILSDDASGRLISLILKKVADSAPQRENKPPIKTYFLAGGRHAFYGRKQPLARFLQSKRNEFGKALLVTEFIDTGTSLSKLSGLLDEFDIDHDIAAVSAREDYINKLDDAADEREHTHDKLIKIKGRLHYGAIDSSGAVLHDNRMSGVKKSRTLSADNQKIIKDDRVAQKTINESREDISKIASEFTKLLMD